MASRGALSVIRNFVLPVLALAAGAVVMTWLAHDPQRARDASSSATAEVAPPN